MSLGKFLRRVWEIIKGIFIKRTRRTYLKEWLEADRLDKGRLLREMEELTSRVYAEAKTNDTKLGEIKARLRASQKKIEEYYRQAKEAQGKDLKAESKALKLAEQEAQFAARIKAQLTSFQAKVKEMYQGWEAQKAKIEEAYDILQQQELDDALLVARNDMLKSLQIFDEHFARFADILPQFNRGADRKEIGEEIAYDEAKLEGRRIIREALLEKRQLSSETGLEDSEEAQAMLEEARRKVGYAPAPSVAESTEEPSKAKSQTAEQ